MGQSEKKVLNLKHVCLKMEYFKIHKIRLTRQRESQAAFAVVRTTFPRRIDARQAAGRKINFRIIITI
jgi:hypothetical protein